MKVLVTGATGFVGLNTVCGLRDADHEVVALTRETSPTERLPEDVETRVGDITDFDTLDGTMGDVDGVVHLAAVHTMYQGTIEDRNFMNWERMKRVNVEGTENLIRAADEAGADQFVFTSTYLAHPTVETRDPNDYVRSKMLAGELFSEIDHGLDYTILHPTTIMGPRDHRLNKFEHFWWVRANRVLMPPLYSPGGRNVVHVEDVVNTARFALEGSSEDHYFVTGENMNGRELHRRIADSIGTTCHVVPVPFFALNHVVAPVVDRLHRRGWVPFEGDDFRVKSDSAIPEEHANQAPVPQQSVRELLEDMVEWYVRVGLL